MSVYGKKKVDYLKQPMFFGEDLNVSRFDEQRFPMFEEQTTKQLSFFWRPEEVDISKDKMDFESLPENEKHIFLSNLRYQTLLDSVQGRAPNLAFLPIVSIPELETWIETWSFSEGIHSRSYTHIIRNISNEPNTIFDGIIEDEEIQKRAASVTHYYDDLIEKVSLYNLLGVGEHTINGEKVSVTMRDLKKSLYLCMMSVNILEAVRFYVSFACSFAFAERKLMEGNAKIIKLIARDESLHLSGTQKILRIMQDPKIDSEMAAIAKECQEESEKMFKEAAEQEKDWATYLFRDGSMIGLNKEILSQYVEYITSLRMKYVKLNSAYPEARSNPIPWIEDWLKSDRVQVAPQEAEISSYLVGQIDSSVNSKELSTWELGD